MPRNSKTILSPVSGLEIGAPGSLIDPRSTPNCLNVEINRLLIRKKRGGAAIGTSLGERVLAFGGFQEDAVNYLLRVGPTKVEKLLGSTWSSIANTALSGDDNTVVDFAFPLLSGKKIAVFTNYFNNIRKWTGTGNDADLGGLPPKCKYLLNFSGYLLALNVDDGSPNKFRSRVQWCDTGDIEQWDGTVAGSNAGAADLLEDDLEITGGGYFGAYAAIHKTDSIYLGYLTGSDDIFRFDRKETTAGTIAHQTIVNIPTGEQLYLSLQGLRLFNGLTAPLIDSTINVEISEGLSPSYAYRSWAIVVKEINEVWIGMPIGSQTDPETIYKYNYLTKQLYKDSNPTVSAVSLFFKSTDDSWDSDGDSWDSDTTRWDTITALALNPRVIWGHANGTTIERTDSADYNGAAIDAYWDSKDFTAADFNVDDPEGILMEWQALETIARGTTLDVYYSTDEGESFIFVKTLSLTSSFPSDIALLMAYVRKLATKFRLRFRNSAVGGSFDLKQFRIKSVPREERRQ